MTLATPLRTLLSAGLLTGLLTQVLPPVWAQTDADPSSSSAAKVAPKTVPTPAKSAPAKNSTTSSVTSKNVTAKTVAAKTAAKATTPDPTVIHPVLTSADLSSTPTRMQRCQVEISGLEGRSRTIALRECLINRTEGERLIARDCSRQYRSLPAGQSADKNTFQKQCIAGALSVAHKELPRRKPAAPKVTADGAASGNISVMPVSAPATSQ
jgi:hypothetical protein